MAMSSLSIGEVIAGVVTGVTTLQVDNININGNAITSTAGTDLAITPLAGQQIVLDGAIVVDAGVVTGATSITSTAFVGDITGDVTGNTSGTAATVTTAAQSAITSVGTLTALQVDNLNINGNAITSTAGTDLTITPLAGQQIVLDGAIVIDAGVVTGATSITSTAFVGDITGDVTGTSDVATVATTVTITDNESTDESNAIIFTAGGDIDGGNIGLESDGTLTYNPSTGKVTATGFVGSGDSITGIESYSPRGLICSNDSDADHDVAISVGGVKDATNTVNITLAAILTKRIDAAWAVGDNNGGLDGTESSGGTPDASTMYYIWLIKRSDTGVVDALYSESATGPTMPTNYDYKRLIGAVKTDSSANVLAFFHSGDYFRYSKPINDVWDTTITSNTYETGTLSSVPPNCLAHLIAHHQNTGETVTDQRRMSLRPNGAIDVATDPSSNFWYDNAGTNNNSQLAQTGFVLVDGSSQVEYTTNEEAGTSTVGLTPNGFIMLTRSNP